MRENEYCEMQILEALRATNDLFRGLVINDNPGLEMVRSIVSEQLREYQEKIIIED